MQGAPTPAQHDPLPRMGALDLPLDGQVRPLAKRHEGANHDVIPSLYLALSYWPGVIEALPAWLSEVYEPATMRTARIKVRDLVEAEAIAVLPQSGPSPK